MTYANPFADDLQPICPACGVTMHPLLDEGLGADECRECGYRVEWPERDGVDADPDADDDRDTRWD
ncbi:hypothetical protein HR12_04590 [Microbacterium sp. SUBG005]|nr:hypothetical protein HR12_04590 [Microbacterium sp. SUBG005]